MTPAQPRDPPRVPLIQQYDIFVEPDVSQQSVAAAAPDEAEVDVHSPRHAVVIYIFHIFLFLFCFLFYY